MQKILFPTLLLASFSSLHAAQEQSAENLPEMVITATRAGSETKNSLSTAATIYDRDDIERLQVRTLPELLRGTAGIDVVQSGGYGKNASVFMRGTNSDHVLVLIDGIKMGSVTSGAAAFENIPMEQVERVEIIRGSQSSLYGSEAIGGVIQIFTRKGGDSEIPTVTLNAGGGTYYTHHSAGSVNGKYKNAWYSVGASNLSSDGFSAQRKPADQDKDGYQNTALNARAGYKFDDNADIDATFMRAEGKNKFDGWSEDNSEFVNQVISITGNVNVNKLWRSTLRLGQTNDEGQNFTPAGKFSSLFESTRWNASWLNQFAVTDNHQIIAGTDYRLDEVNSTTIYQQKSRYDVGVFGELHSRLLNDHFINASVRWDENEAFGDYVTGSVGWRFNWQHGISVLANFGNAFKAPTFNDLYYPNAGNPNLKPEESKSYEVGLVGEHNWGQWEVRAYHINVDNLINWVPDATQNWRPQNVAKAQIQGIEAEIGTEIYGFRPKLTMNLLNPEDTTTGNRLARRADKTLAFDISRSISDFDLGAAVIAQGQRFDDAANKTPVDGFVTVDLRSAYHFNKNWMLSAKLNNLLDKNYQTVNTYNMADRNFFVSIHYNN
jgi:vitamin B12 transporter